VTGITNDARTFLRYCPICGFLTRQERRPPPLPSTTSSIDSFGPRRASNRTWTKAYYRCLRCSSYHNIWE